jgi:hypothetical protein
VLDQISNASSGISESEHNGWGNEYDDLESKHDESERSHDLGRMSSEYWSDEQDDESKSKTTEEHAEEAGNEKSHVYTREEKKKRQRVVPAISAPPLQSAERASLLRSKLEVGAITQLEYDMLVGKDKAAHSRNESAALSAIVETETEAEPPSSACSSTPVRKHQPQPHAHPHMSRVPRGKGGSVNFSPLFDRLAALASSGLTEGTGRVGGESHDMTRLSQQLQLGMDLGSKDGLQLQRTIFQDGGVP